MAASAEERKALKYSHLTPSYLFTTVAIEISGAIGPRSRAFLRVFGRRVHLESGEANSTSYLLQRISVAVQRGNVVAVMGCAQACWLQFSRVLLCLFCFVSYIIHILFFWLVFVLSCIVIIKAHFIIKFVQEVLYIFFLFCFVLLLYFCSCSKDFSFPCKYNFTYINVNNEIS